jgi:hypothetical protein
MASTSTASSYTSEEVKRAIDDALLKRRTTQKIFLEQQLGLINVSNLPDSTMSTWRAKICNRLPLPIDVANAYNILFKEAGSKFTAEASSGDIYNEVHYLNMRVTAFRHRYANKIVQNCYNSMAENIGHIADETSSHVYCIDRTQLWITSSLSEPFLGALKVQDAKTAFRNRLDSIKSGAKVIFVVPSDQLINNTKKYVDIKSYDQMVRSRKANVDYYSALFKSAQNQLNSENECEICREATLNNHFQLIYADALPFTGCGSTIGLLLTKSTDSKIKSTYSIVQRYPGRQNVRLRVAEEQNLMFMHLFKYFQICYKSEAVTSECIDCFFDLGWSSYTYAD